MLLLCYTREKQANQANQIQYFIANFKKTLMQTYR
jgi:hypothetical protein